MGVKTSSRTPVRSPTSSYQPKSSAVTKMKAPPSSSTSHNHSQTSRTPAAPLNLAAISASQAASLHPPPSRTPNNVPERAPSPNYFALVVDESNDPRDSGAGPKENWSPPTSSIRSFAGATPTHVPADANAEFEAFRKQAEMKNNFNLSHGNLTQLSTPLCNPSNSSTSHKESGSSQSPGGPSRPKMSPRGDSYGLVMKNKVEQRKSDKQAGGSADQGSFFDMPRQESPASIQSSGRATPLAASRHALSRLDDRHPRLSLPSGKANPASPRPKYDGVVQRADTLPVSLTEGPEMISAHGLKEILNSLPTEQFLLLDLRVFPQFSVSRIKDALNLCIPTTLLKRPSFNLQKLTDTFTSEEEKERFQKWRNCKYIIVYDAASYEKKDALSAANTLKKFNGEEWNGESFILKGGFREFSKQYSALIDNRSSRDMQSSKKNLSLNSGMPDVAPVAGGCLMPPTKSAANPFFSNIRQNMDLVGGVGQQKVKRPEIFNTSSVAEKVLPPWLLKATATADNGKIVSEKFLRIEQEEQARMQQALSSKAQIITPSGTSARNRVEIAGLEKGNKNRYNNIWPFEHARVKLQGRQYHECDYVNASHIKASRSNKQYIASQGPLPATFGDFWSVVWDQDVRVIVMLTAESEGGQLKCHPYWRSQEYGQFRLKGLSEKKVSLDPQRLSNHRRSSPPTKQEIEQALAQAGRKRAATATTDPADAANPATPANNATNESPYVIIRKFTLSHLQHPFLPMREITQLHYSSWPDFGAPAQPSHLLGLIELSNSIQRASTMGTSVGSSNVSAGGAGTDGPDEGEGPKHPMLVHCSAGCGRTGTFCTVDSVIDMLKRQRRSHRSGVTPMEIENDGPSAPRAGAGGEGSGSQGVNGDYLGKGKQNVKVEDEWVFDGETDLIQKTVEDFRLQRISMVQSLRQFVLCYETVLEWIAMEYKGERGGKREG